MNLIKIAPYIILALVIAGCGTAMVDLLSINNDKAADTEAFYIQIDQASTPEAGTDTTGWQELFLVEAGYRKYYNRSQTDGAWRLKENHTKSKMTNSRINRSLTKVTIPEYKITPDIDEDSGEMELEKLVQVVTSSVSVSNEQPFAYRLSTFWATTAPYLIEKKSTCLY